MCAYVCGYRVYLLELTTDWMWGHEAVAASPQVGCWLWQITAGTVQTMICESEDPGESMKTFAKKNNEDTNISFPVITLEEGYRS